MGVVKTKGGSVRISFFPAKLPLRNSYEGGVVSPGGGVVGAGRNPRVTKGQLEGGRKRGVVRTGGGVRAGNDFTSYEGTT